MTSLRGTRYEIDCALPGRLATMAHPRGLTALDADMAALRADGVDVVLSLQTAEERAELGLTDESGAAQRAGMTYREMPIRDMSTPNLAVAGSTVDDIVADLRAGRHVVVHCWAGIGRSSTIAAAVLIRLGASAADACETVSGARGMRVPETQEQRAWLDEWAAACVDGFTA